MPAEAQVDDWAVSGRKFKLAPQRLTKFFEKGCRGAFLVLRHLLGEFPGKVTLPRRAEKLDIRDGRLHAIPGFFGYYRVCRFLKLSISVNQIVYD